MLLVMELCNRGGLNELLEEKIRFNEQVIKQAAEMLAKLSAD